MRNYRILAKTAAFGAAAWLASAAPIDLEFFGYAEQDATLHAFLRGRGTIVVAVEGELILDQYRVVRIEPPSVVVEDSSTGTRHTLLLVGPADHIGSEQSEASAPSASVPADLVAPEQAAQASRPDDDSKPRQPQRRRHRR